MSGRCTNVSSTDLPQNRPRASSKPTAKPKGRLASIAVVETSRLRRSAVHSSSDSQFTPSTLRTRAAVQNGKTMLLEQALGGLGPEIGEEGRRIRMSRVLRERERVDNLGVRVGREGSQYLYARVRSRVRRVDDPERAFATRHEQQRGADVLALRELVLDALPGAELLKRRPAVFPGRNRVHSGECEPLFAQGGREV